MQLITQDPFGNWKLLLCQSYKDKSLHTSFHYIKIYICLRATIHSCVWGLCGETSHCAEEEHDSGFSLAATTVFLQCKLLMLFIHYNVPYNQEPHKIAAVSFLLYISSAKLKQTSDTKHILGNQLYWYDEKIWEKCTFHFHLKCPFKILRQPFTWAEINCKLTESYLGDLTCDIEWLIVFVRLLHWGMNAVLGPTKDLVSYKTENLGWGVFSHTFIGTGDYVDTFLKCK